MHTRCPHCSTTFSISQQHLDMAEDQVRCGSCDQVFNGRDNIVDAKGQLIRKANKGKSSEFETGDDVFGMIEEASVEDEAKLKPHTPHMKSVDESWADALIVDEGGHGNTAPPPKIETAISKKQSANLVSEPVSAPTRPRPLKTPQAPQTKPKPTHKKAQRPSTQQPELSDEFLNIDEQDRINNPFRDSDQSVQPSVQQPTQPMPTDKKKPTANAPDDDKNWIDDVWDEKEDGLSDQDLLDELEQLNQASPNKPLPQHSTTSTTQTKPPAPVSKPKPPAAKPPIDDANDIFNELEEFITTETATSPKNKARPKKPSINATSKPSIIDELEDIAGELGNQTPMRAIPTDKKKPGTKTPSPSAKKNPTKASNSPVTPDAKQAPLFHLNFDPVEIQPRFPPPKQKKSSTIYSASILLTGLLLAFQFSFFNMNEFARDPLYRPYYQKACAILSCTLPMLQNLSKIRGSHLVVRQHPDHAKALIIDIIMTNKANYPQLFPIMELVFTDSEHAPVRQRQFKPKEYLTGDLRTLNTMPPNTPVHISLEVLDPGPKAKGWEISFLAYLEKP